MSSGDKKANTEKHPGYRYLDPEKCRKMHNCGSSVEVKCYDHGDYWVCPNPRDEARTEAFADLHARGGYRSFVIYRITEQQFADKGNWNS